MMKLKLRAIGNSIGVILPKDLLSKLRVEKDDSLYIIETSNGFSLSPYDKDFDQAMNIAEKVMRRDRDVLKKLSE